MLCCSNNSQYITYLSAIVFMHIYFTHINCFPVYIKILLKVIFSPKTVIPTTKSIILWVWGQNKIPSGVLLMGPVTVSQQCHLQRNWDHHFTIRPALNSSRSRSKCKPTFVIYQSNLSYLQWLIKTLVHRCQSKNKSTSQERLAVVSSPALLDQIPAFCFAVACLWEAAAHTLTHFIWLTRILSAEKCSTLLCKDG